MLTTDVMDRTGESSSVDPGHFRRVLGHYPTGVCVVTALDDGVGPVGMTVGSFTSVSMDPPLVAFYPMAGSATFQAISRAGRFCVNVLAREQEDLCRLFASRADDKFGGVGWELSPLGSPILDGVVAWVDCTLASVHEAGDHLSVLGEVESLSTGETTAPLMFFQGGYGRFSALSLTAGAEDDLGAQLRLADLARPYLEALSRTYGVEAHASALAGDRIIQLAWVAAQDVGMTANKVGLRLPFVPPMGLLFVAWEDDAVRGKWLERCGRSLGAALRQAYSDDLARARAQRWIATPDHERLRQVEATVVRLATQGQLPQLQRELRAHLEEYAAEYAFLTAGGSDGSPPSALSAPVFDRAGRVALVLAVQGLSASENLDLVACRTSLLAAADALTGTIGGRPAT